MPTDRSDKLHADWKASTEKFDYFILGVVCALCAFIAQGYKPAKLGINPSTLEFVALLVFVLAVVAGFRRIERTLQVTLLNHQVLHAYEARGGMVSKMSEGRTLINEATGQLFSPEQAQARVAELTKSIQELKPLLESAKARAHVYYTRRNGLSLTAFLLLLSARVWSAYA
jgi:hypothetical protein